MTPALTRRHTLGFSVTEVVVAMAVSAFMFACVLTCVVTLQRSFNGTMDFAHGTADQTRALDYIARDLRRALTVTVSGSNQTLTVTIPDTYGSYDSQGNPVGALVNPTITSSSTNPVTYNDATKPLTICYYIQGSQLLRQQTIGATGAVNTLVIADSVESLQSSFQDLTSVVNFSITFAPDFSIKDQGNAQSRQSTVLTGSTSIRNHREN